MGIKLNLEGQTFTNWTVLYKDSIDSGGRSMWMCRCKCGTEKLVGGSALKSGRSKSCGCFQKETKGPQWSGMGELSGSFFSTIKRNANSRDIEFNITKEYIWELFLAQDRKCALSGIELTFAPTNENRDLHLKTASLDRIDSNKAYEIGNVQWIHKDINLMKNVLGQEYFIELCSKISNYSGGACEVTRI